MLRLSYIRGLQVIKILERTVRRVKNLHAETGKVESGLKSSGQPRSLNAHTIDLLCWIISRYPQTDAKMLHGMLQAQGHHTLIPSLYRTINRLGYTYKKVSVAAAKRNPLLRATYLNNVAMYRPEQLVFLDETAKDDRTTIKKSGWSYRGQDATVHERFGRGIR